MSSLLIFDVLLAGILVAIAWRVLTAEDLFKAIVLFITFGILMALVWVRLRAPDLALVEAAIGAGVTGALLLDTLGRMEAREEAAASRNSHDPDTSEGG